MTSRLTSRFASLKRANRASMLALPLAALGCAPAIEPGPALNQLAVLDGTESCDGVFNSSDVAFVCRQIPQDRLETLTAYQNALLAQGWGATLRDSRESRFVGANHFPTESLWFERAVSARCSEVISVDVAAIETVDDGLQVGLFIIDGYAPVCGDGRRAQ